MNRNQSCLILLSIVLDNDQYFALAFIPVLTNLCCSQTKTLTSKWTHCALLNPVTVSELKYYLSKKTKSDPLVLRLSVNEL